MRAASPSPTKQQLQELRKAGAHRKEIANLYGVSLSTVKRWLAKDGVCKRTTRRDEVRAKREERARETRIEQVPMQEGEGITLMEKAKQILGERMGEDHRGYILDGRPCSSMQIVKAAGLSLGR